ncbi:MAG: hypothetical protein KAS59_10075 [Alphaproteobacteria bacterium]|nr:hypothetical protein [Alphaproteobacteria bacterium]MCK5658882.1 hypothetical protein [Alphaproteobacteria bacterium]
MSKNNSKYTPSQAIRAIKGMTRKRFYEMLKNGEISYTKEKWGKKERHIVDGSELARVFSSDFKIKETTETEKRDNLKQKETTETNIENKLLQQKVSFLDEKIQSQNKLLSEATEREKNLLDKLDKTQSTIDRQTNLIEDLRDKPPKKLVEKPKRFLGIFPYKSA